MSHARTLKPGQPELEQSTNPAMMILRDDGWYNREKVIDKDSILRDAKRSNGSLLFGGVSFSQSLEFNSKRDEKEAFRAFVARVLLHKLPPDKHEKYCDRLETAYIQSLSGVLPTCVIQAFLDQYFPVSSKFKHHVDISYKKGKIIATAHLSEIKLFKMEKDPLHPEDESLASPDLEHTISLPGKGKVCYILTKRGFKIALVSVSNTLLKEIILNGEVELTEEKLASAKLEEAQNKLRRACNQLRKKLIQIPWSETIRAMGFTFLSETETLRERWQNSIDHTTKLTQAVVSIKALMNAKTEETQRAALRKVKKAHDAINHDPWGRIYAGFLWNFTSVIMAAGNMLALSNGIISPPIALGLGIAACATSAYATQNTLFGETAIAKAYADLETSISAKHQSPRRPSSPK